MNIVTLIVGCLVAWLLVYLVNLGLVSAIADRFDTRDVERNTPATRMVLIFGLGPLLTLFIGILMVAVGFEVLRGWTVLRLHRRRIR